MTRAQPLCSRCLPWADRYDRLYSLRSVSRSVWLVLSVMLGSALGCSGDTTVSAPLHDAAQAYWALQLNQHAVMLAITPPYNTVQLAATPVTAAGTPLVGLGVARFTATDSTVTVDSMTGLATAHFNTSGQATSIVARLAAQGVTHTDTVFIQVTDTVPQHPLTTFSMQPMVGDSAKRALDFFLLSPFAWPILATDAAGDSLCNRTQCVLQVAYTSSNPNIVSFYQKTSQLIVQDTGRVVLTATTLAYGVARRDSVVFTVGYPINVQISFCTSCFPGKSQLGFSAPPHVLMGIGAMVTFHDLSAQPVDVVFDDSTGMDTASCKSLQNILTNSGPPNAPPTGSGNIPLFGGDTTPIQGFPSFTKYLKDIDYRCRRFPTPRTYRVHSTLVPEDTFTLDVKSQP